MLVIIKSGPATLEGERAVRLAGEMGSDICLVQNGVYFVHSSRLGNFGGSVCALDEDVKLRGLTEEVKLNGIKTVNYGGLVDLMAAGDSVAGMF